MSLARDTVCQQFDIWQPRWKDRTVLLAAHKVGTHNLVVFTKAPTLPGEYYISGRDVHMCSKTTNGKIEVYEVPLKFLEPLEREDKPTPYPRSARQQVMEF